MSSESPRLHLISNAHIDPVWLWEWEEGAAAAISTFRTAADLCEEFPGYIFNHNEVILYEWVREYEPALFARIQRLVQAGKWHIMGGWYLQPDCNMPSGESLVRNILAGRRYFAEHFGARPTTAINFDPFGHSRGLVQILTQAGFDSYLICRPDPNELPLPANEFEWVGFDGSSVRVARSPEWYLSALGKAAEKVTGWLNKNATTPLWFILWGVGDHGGGPSRQDLRDLAKLIAQTKSHEVVHSTTEAYFAESLKRNPNVPRVERDLNLCFPGCYTSMVRIKQKHRLLENELYSTEKMAATAALQGLLAYPREELGQALKDLLFGEFHDILPGSSIQPVEDAALRMMAHGLEILSRVKTRAFFALASGQKKAAPGEIPVLVYNPHPYPVRGVFEVEFQLEDFNTSGQFADIKMLALGKAVPAQVEQEESNLNLDWRKRVVFAAELAPSQMVRFDAKPVGVPAEPQPALQAKNGVIAFRSKDLALDISTRTGLVEKLRVHGKDVTGKGAFTAVAYEDIADSWGSKITAWRKRVGTFKCMSAARSAQFAGVLAKKLPAVRVTEDGAARTVVEAFLEFADSTACIRYKLPKQGTEFEVELRGALEREGSHAQTGRAAGGRGRQGRQVLWPDRVWRAAIGHRWRRGRGPKVGGGGRAGHDAQRGQRWRLWRQLRRGEQDARISGPALAGVFGLERGPAAAAGR